MLLKRYHVKLELKATVAEAAEHVTVEYEAENYNEAWVGARTVCRLGTSAKRRFCLLDEAKTPFEIGPAVYTVRGIFQENTRKTGKTRMMTLTADTLMQVINGRDIRISKRLEEVLRSVITESEQQGLRITVATARRLGVEVGDETGSSADDQEEKSA